MIKCIFYELFPSGPTSFSFFLSFYFQWNLIAPPFLKTMLSVTKVYKEYHLVKLGGFFSAFIFPDLIFILYTQQAGYYLWSLPCTISKSRGIFPTFALPLSDHLLGPLGSEGVLCEPPEGCRALEKAGINISLYTFQDCYMLVYSIHIGTYSKLSQSRYVR